MRKSWNVVLGVLAAAAMASGCTSAPSSARRPLVTIPASAATTRATGIKSWRLHDYRNGGTTGLTIVGLDAHARVASAARIFHLAAKTPHVAAVASLYPTVGRMRFDDKKVVELNLTRAQGTLYDLFQADAKHAGNLAYDCSTGSAVHDGVECGVAVAICSGTTPADPACWGGAALCAIDTFNDASSCFGDSSGSQDPGSSDPGSSDPGSTDPGSSDPGSGDTTVAGGDTGDTGAAGDTGVGGDTGDTGATDVASGDDGGYDPSGDFGAGDDVASCADCGDGFDDASADG